MKLLQDLIAEHQFFADFPTKEIATLAGCARNVTHDAGAYLLKEGDDANAFHLIRRGVVVLESYWPGRGPVTIDTLTAGDFVGVGWLVPPHKWSFDARAKDAVSVVEFDAACLRGKCDADPALGYALMKQFVPALVEGLRNARLQAMDLCAKP